MTKLAPKLKSWVNRLFFLYSMLYFVKPYVTPYNLYLWACEREGKITFNHMSKTVNDNVSTIHFDGNQAVFF